mmetsp:Transcript_65653/g.145283  ORF Transcript_65653/g.145283 Transcript_65653/m.145283 type:complete len:252 (-) Transcript_65653:123-878(-)
MRGVSKRGVVAPEAGPESAPCVGVEQRHIVALSPSMVAGPHRGVSGCGAKLAPAPALVPVCNGGCSGGAVTAPPPPPPPPPPPGTALEEELHGAEGAAAAPRGDAGQGVRERTAAAATGVVLRGVATPPRVVAAEDSDVAATMQGEGGCGQVAAGAAMTADGAAAAGAVVAATAAEARRPAAAAATGETARRGSLAGLPASGGAANGCAAPRCPAIVRRTEAEGSPSGCCPAADATGIAHMDDGNTAVPGR